MKRSIPWLLAGLVAVALAIDWTRPSSACGPFYFPPVFTDIRHPDSLLGPYTRGRLGVLQPGYYRIYLYVAYRNLAGRSFDRSQALALWGLPPESAYLLEEPPRPSPAPPLASPPPQPTDWPHAWIDARNRVPDVAHANYLVPWPYEGTQPVDVPTPDGIYRNFNTPDGRFLNYPNCLPQAFQAAVTTLRDRTQKYRAANSDLVAWVTAQDQVFSNCVQGESLPAALAADAPPLAPTGNTKSPPLTSMRGISAKR